MTELEMIAQQMKDPFDKPRDWDAIERRLKCTPCHGLKVAWFYKDDKEFYEGESLDPRAETQYHGTIIGDAGTSPRGELSIANCILVIDSYPIEKENPTISLCALYHLLDDENLIEMFEAPSPAER